MSVRWRGGYCFSCGCELRLTENWNGHRSLGGDKVCFDCFIRERRDSVKDQTKLIDDFSGLGGKHCPRINEVEK